jgi:hypothetical protein
VQRGATIAGGLPTLAYNFDDPSRTVSVFRSRAVLTVDTRSQTEYGTLRSYFAFGPTWDNGSQSNPTSVYAYRGFIQWAGFTAGRSVSFFDAFSFSPYSNQTNYWGSDTGGTGINLLGYTAQVGNGFSATISAEDSVQRRNVGGGVNNIDAGTALTNACCIPGAGAGNGYAGAEIPDIVANLRIDQAWGNAQIMGALHRVEAVSNVAGTSSNPDKWGWAVGAGVNFNLPFIGAGDTIGAQVTYAEGALNYIGNGMGPGYFLTRGFPTVNEVAFGAAVDAVLLPGNDLHLTTGWSVVAAYQHVWNPRWRTSIYGAYGEVTFDTAVTAGTGIGDWSGWQLGTRTLWTPVTNLDLSLDIMWNQVNGQTIAGVDTEIGYLAGMVRAQRNFYP